MSLLNDALKAAEQRQDRPAPSPYVGRGAAVPSRRRNLGMVVAGIGVIALLGAGTYLYLEPARTPTIPMNSEVEQEAPDGNAADGEPESSQAAPSPELTAQPSVAEPEPEVDDPLAETDQGTADIVMQSAREEEAEPVMSPPDVPAPLTTEPESAPQVETAAAPEPAEPAPVQRGPKPPAQTTRAARADTERESAASPEQPDNTSAAQQATADATVKQARQTPAQRDLAASREIRKLVSNGDLMAAEARLNELTDTQTAPRSRYTFARSVLARGDVERALAWVPENLVAHHPDLRLIRARAILAGGELDQAVATLQSGVPPVADNVEYRVTLATLLQQQGQSAQAANHWAELIAWDNGQAPWWVGLAIALEGRGDIPAARRAYQQAAALPGLAPSLADYVRQRLQTLGAG